MLRLNWPRSTRTMLLAVSPRSLVKSAIAESAGRVDGSLSDGNGTKQGLARVIVNVQLVPSKAFGLDAHRLMYGGCVIDLYERVDSGEQIGAIREHDNFGACCQRRRHQRAREHGCRQQAAH